jgi:hypothetical protein
MLHRLRRNLSYIDLNYSIENLGDMRSVKVKEGLRLYDAVQVQQRASLNCRQILFITSFCNNFASLKHNFAKISFSSLKMKKGFKNIFAL